jgi:catechol 2,3-dioxygenase-like lactoylglutathione lyase family enzyme
MPNTTIAEPATNVRQAVPFFWVHDLEVSRRFYVDGLGFQVTRHWIDAGRLRWCWLELGGAALMLQEFWREGHHRNLPETTSASVYPSPSSVPTHSRSSDPFLAARLARRDPPSVTECG